MSASRVSIRTPACLEPQATEAREPIILILDERGRDALLARAAADLPEGECLVEVKDLASRRRSFETRPSDPRARLVGEGLPTLLRGTLVSRVRYYRVPADAMAGIETHHENGAFSHQYEVELRPLVRGRAPATRPALAA